MKQKRPRGSIVRWEVTMEQQWFDVTVEYENEVQKNFTYQFKDYEDFLTQMRKFKKHGIPKNLMQEVFDEYVHNVDYIPQLHPRKEKKKTSKKKVSHNNYRSTPEYIEWREAVLERDGRICCCCGSPFYIEAHHKNTKYHVNPTNYDINNGITLCHRCHTLEHKKKEEN